MPRADQLLVDLQLANSRTHARKLIDGGRVQVRSGPAWEPLRKPSQKLDASAEIRVEALPEDRFVSRAGLKLEAILERTGIDVQGWHALDVGCSTGGFSDCLLQRGAALVVGVDVGHDQLSPKLRNDPRMHLYEGVNARNLNTSLRESHAPAGFDGIVMDVSFISQKLILPRLPALLAEGGSLLSLIKPQFEVGPEGIGKGGIVRDEKLYPQVEHAICELCESLDLRVQHYIDSPITGGDGNREFLLWAIKK
ncbi:TlyA family RNA methyltransferase [Biformimicrobium ophioploci]|nr:TlyA family RNA methyltransferase [Microbulbifer sp. NKW57]